MNEQVNFSRCSHVSCDDLIRKFKDRKLSLKCLHSRSNLRKFLEILRHLSTLKNKFTYMIITESWSTRDNNYAHEIPGYLSKFLYITATTRGGIKIYYLEGNVAKVLEKFVVCNSLYEFLLLKTNIPVVRSAIACRIYRMLNNLVDRFLDHITNFPDSCFKNRTIITGSTIIIAEW